MEDTQLFSPSPCCAENDATSEDHFNNEYHPRRKLQGETLKKSIKSAMHEKPMQQGQHTDRTQSGRLADIVSLSVEIARVT